MAKKSFLYEYEAEQQSTLAYSLDEDQKLNVSIAGDEASLYLNRPGMLTLAKILIKMAQAEYPEGFHVHLCQDFGDEQPERLTVFLWPDDVSLEGRDEGAPGTAKTVRTTL